MFPGENDFRKRSELLTGLVRANLLILAVEFDRYEVLDPMARLQVVEGILARLGLDDGHGSR